MLTHDWCVNLLPVLVIVVRTVLGAGMGAVVIMMWSRPYWSWYWSWRWQWWWCKVVKRCLQVIGACGLDPLGGVRAPSLAVFVGGDTERLGGLLNDGRQGHIEPWQDLAWHLMPDMDLLSSQSGMVPAVHVQAKQLLPVHMLCRISRSFCWCDTHASADCVCLHSRFAHDTRAV